jgi:hypothetical protein
MTEVNATKLFKKTKSKQVICIEKYVRGDTWVSKEYSDGFDVCTLWYYEQDCHDTIDGDTVQDKIKQWNIEARGCAIDAGLKRWIDKYHPACDIDDPTWVPDCQVVYDMRPNGSVGDKCCLHTYRVWKKPALEGQVFFAEGMECKEDLDGF